MYISHGANGCEIRRHSRAWWYIPVIPALRKLRQEDHKFDARLGYEILS
jgi:hypothetical protein